MTQNPTQKIMNNSSLDEYPSDADIEDRMSQDEIDAANMNDYRKLNIPATEFPVENKKDSVIMPNVDRLEKSKNKMQKPDSA